MYRGKQLSVVIPTHNEAASVAGVLDAVPDVVDEVLVVDWNSDDGTPELAREHGARVIQEARQGYGQAYLTGVPAATGDVVITLDADGNPSPITHHPSTHHPSTFKTCWILLPIRAVCAGSGNGPRLYFNFDVLR